MRISGILSSAKTIHVSYRQIIRFLTFLIPGMIFLAGFIFPLRDIVRQALVGILLIWLYMGAMTGFKFFG